MNILCNRLRKVRCISNHSSCISGINLSQSSVSYASTSSQMIICDGSSQIYPLFCVDQRLRVGSPSVLTRIGSGIETRAIR